MRQIDPIMYRPTLEAELFRDGRSKFTVPLDYYRDFMRLPFKSDICKQYYKKAFENEQGVNLKRLRYFNVSSLWLTITALLRFYEEWLNPSEMIDTVQVVIRLRNVGNSVAYYDSDDWGEHTEKYGMPINHKRDIRIPSDTKNHLVLNIRDEHTPLGTRLCGFISFAFGLPLDLYGRIYGDAINKAAKNSKKPE